MNESAKPVIAAIEAGGTKVQVAVGTDWNPSAYLTIQTTNNPIETMTQALVAIDECAAGRAIDGIGIASFGPIDVNSQSGQYGVIGATPKPGWQGFDYRGFFGSHLKAPVVIDTDVNAAALAEYHMGNHNIEGGLAYATIGTGIGAGIVAAGSVRNGSRHPEIGHIPLRRHPNDSAFKGVCPFHADCAEGLASGPAVMARWGSTL
ncbi:MAG: ROK family protein, partial [Luminiphilus sp.]|nr:ROK family protein [Luminiphilus sp.]